MNDDAALLRRFVDERSETALAELVRRHVDLIYTFALWRADGNADAAGAVVQEVFSKLAREATWVSRHAIVVGWLCKAMGPAPAIAPADERGGAEDSVGSWRRRVPDALNALPDDDRAALLLHYFEGRSLAEVGVALHLGEEAARLCTRRAFDKLRSTLGLRGARIGPTELSTWLADQRLTPAPAGLAERVAAAAVAAELIGGERRSLGASLIGMINSGFALGTAAVIAIGAALAWGYRTNSRLEAEIERLRGEQQVFAGLQRDNRRMARLVEEAEELRREVADLPALRAKAQAAETVAGTGTVSLEITPEGAIRWEDEAIGLEQLLVRLREFQARFPAADSSVFLRSGGAPLSAITYVLNEARKAGIRRLLVDGDPAPDAHAGGWF